jgi:adenosylcobinamide-phosphate synthase
VAHLLSPPLGPDPWLLAAAVAADLLLGDPAYAAHPVRLMGGTLVRIESGLRRVGADGYLGGVVLFGALATLWLGLSASLVLGADRVHPWLGGAAHLFLLYSFLALGDLLRHASDVERALRRSDLPAARAAVARLVGRDTDRMDAGACRRSVIESLSESLTDGFVGPVFWYALLGLPGLVVFKVVSTMDSMVGYKTPRYLRFGWCGARLDDAMNWLPARLTWLLIALAALAVPGCSARAALAIGWAQAGLLPSPNSGWPEAATAGAIRRRLVGPIWSGGSLVTDLWIGDPESPPAESAADLRRARAVAVASGALATIAAVTLLALD